MKKLQAIKMFAKTGFIAAALFLTACSDDGDSSGTGGSTKSFIKGKVDGTQFKNLEIQGQSTVVATSTGSGDQRLIMLTGSDSNTNAMSVIMLGINEPGTYTVDANSGGTVLAYIPSGQSSFDTSNCDGATGTLKITKIDAERVEGTFSYTGKVDEDCSQSKSITDGSFRGIFLQAQN